MHPGHYRFFLIPPQKFLLKSSYQKNTCQSFVPEKVPESKISNPSPPGQTILFERWVKTERVSGRLGRRPHPSHLASLSGAHSPVSSEEACFLLLLEYQAGASAEERGGGTRKRNANWLGCGRSDLALLAGPHRTPLKKNSSLEPYLCQGVALPSAFFVFSLWGKGTATYAKLPSFYASITPIPISVSDQNNFIFNIFLSWICISGHFGFSSDKDDRLIAILLDHFRRLKSVRVIYP